LVSSMPGAATPAFLSACSALYEDKGQMVFLLYIPSGVDPRQLEAEVRSSLKKHNVSKINVDVV
jgi:hypothetical protein